ncbi:MAG: hypothetical protein P3W87_006425 [Gammaproteobacteria bacterium]|nr:hypothetical protein [Gammaproteobacteria bacterium]
MLDPSRPHHAYDLRGRVGIDFSTDDFFRLLHLRLPHARGGTSIAGRGA